METGAVILSTVRYCGRVILAGVAYRTSFRRDGAGVGAGAFSLPMSLVVRRSGAAFSPIAALNAPRLSRDGAVGETK